MKQVDIVVIGAGSLGAMALWQLGHRSDLRVLGIERYGPVNRHGSYAGESRLFRTAVKEGRIFNDLADRSVGLWRDLEEQAGRSIRLPCGALSIGPPDIAPMAATARVIGEFDIPHRMLDERQLRDQYPQFAIDAGDIGILDVRGGALRPEVAVFSALQVAEDRGVDMWYGTEVVDIAPDETGVVVTTGTTAVRADRVMVTAGSWTTELLPELAGLIDVRPIGLTWAMPTDISRYTPEHLPVFLRDRVEPDGSIVHWFGTPTLDGYSIKIGLYPERWDAVSAVSDVPTAYTEERLDEIGPRLVECMPGLIGAPVRASVHHDGYTGNAVPVVERFGGGRVIVAAGLSGNGFKFAPAYGLMLAQLAIGDESDLLRPEFAADRHPERGPVVG